MAVFDCGSGATLFINNYAAATPGQYANLAQTVGGAVVNVGQVVFSDPYQTIQVFCTGVVETIYSPGGSVTAQIGPAPSLPTVDVLLGLTGIVCALLVAWSFNRS